VFGRPLVELHFVQRAGCQIVRVMHDRIMVPVSPDLVLEKGQRLLVVGTEDDLAAAVDYLGKRSDEPFFMDAERERKQVVVTSQAVVGRSLRGLDVLRAYGVTVSRVVRNDVSFVPNADTIVEQFDVLTVVGEPANLENFATTCGHRTKAMDETDLASLSLGITLGVIVGLMPLGFGEGHSLSLGMAGGPLLVALLLGHFGHIGKISGYTPRAARYLMTELGLALFLAGAGISAGASFLEVIRQQGLKLFLMGAIVTTVPMIVGYIAAMKFMKLNFLEMLGGTCGGMTSTPGLGAVTAKTDSDIPVTSYATAYPVALIFMTIAAQVLLSLLK
jgi:putative transport protein